jgi:hypothetical protein
MKKGGAHKRGQQHRYFLRSIRGVEKWAAHPSPMIATIYCRKSVTPIQFKKTVFLENR